MKQPGNRLTNATLIL